MIFRKARMSDLNQLVFMARKFWEESPYNGFSFASDKIAAWFRNAIDDETCFVGVIASDKVHGMIAGQLISPVFSHDKVAAEIAWYVHPDFRHSSVAMRLIKEYENWAKTAKVSNFSMLSTSPAVVKDVYTRLGYSPVEITYQKVN